MTLGLMQRQSMALHLRLHDLQREEEESDGDSDVTNKSSLGGLDPMASSSSCLKPDKQTSDNSLFLSLLVTFLYQANQYIVAPTSGKYADRLGMLSPSYPIYISCKGLIKCMFRYAHRLSVCLSVYRYISCRAYVLLGTSYKKEHSHN